MQTLDRINCGETDVKVLYVESEFCQDREKCSIGILS